MCRVSQPTEGKNTHRATPAFTPPVKPPHSDPMPDEPEPTRKVYGFKPKEFERANPARPSDPADAPVPTRDPGIIAADEGKIEIHDLLRAGAGPGSQLGSNAVKNRANDIHAMLRDNHARANAAGINDVVLTPKRMSKRKRDFFFLLVSGNLILSLGFILQPIFAGAGVVIFNIGLVWIMWVVLDDY